MNQELVRINSTDNIEQVGILYTPQEKTKKIVIHVHGLNGNFYENRFLDTLAKRFTKKNIAFLTINNRGTNYITEFWKGEETIVIGGCLERFKDCILDLEGVVNWVKEKGFEEVILEGHSYGCNKVTDYYTKKKEECIKKIILLAPCDIPTEIKKFLGQEEYERAKEEAEKLIKLGREDELIDFSIMANNKVSAKTFYYDFLPQGENDFFSYSKENTNPILKNISIPVCIIFGDNDECVLTEKIEKIKKFWKKNMKDCTVNILPDSNHSFQNKELELGNIIEKII